MDFLLIETVTGIEVEIFIFKNHTFWYGNKCINKHSVKSKKKPNQKQQYYDYIVTTFYDQTC